MQIGIDVSSLVYQRGVSRYTANIARALADRDDASLWLYGYAWRQRQALESMAQSLVAGTASHGQTRVQRLPPTVQNMLWSKLGWNPVRKLLPEIDIFHSWDWLQPPDRDLPLVSTIHDLAILKFPETAHPDVVAKHRRSWQVLQERRAHIIAVSRATKKDIVERLQIPSYRVHVVHEALPDEFRQVCDALDEESYQRVTRQLQLDKPYILFVGTQEPRKNLARLLQAWQPLAKDYQLILVGLPGWDKTPDEIRALGSASQHVRCLGQVTDAELVVLYGEAQLLAYTCLDEGFGLPILEAFYVGTPVVTSHLSAMPEVAGNAAELVDPFSVESIRSGLERVLAESTGEQQKRLQRMIIRLQMFDWRRVAEETMAVYKKALQQ